MAKNSGNTRRKNPSTSVNEQEGLSQRQWDAIVSGIAKSGDIDYDQWQELDQEQQELALMEAGFTGAISDDLGDATLYLPESKDNMVAWFQDDLVNEMWGHQIQDISWTVLYKDGSKKYLDETSNDFADAHITNNMVKQAYTNAKKALRLGSVAAIIRTDAGGQPTFYLAKGGEQRMREYGFELWKNGRGEKKRDYIQDDWI